MKKLNRLKIFYQQHILPIVYDYSMSLSEVVQKLVKVVNNLVDEVGDIEDKTVVYDDKIAALESKAADQAVYNEHINTAIEEINNTISELPTYDVIEDLRTDITNINSSIADLDTRVTVLEGQNIYQRLDTAEQNIANLGNDVDALELDVSNIHMNISNIENDISDIQDDITNINGEITTINEDMSDMLDDISAIQGDITNINGSITSIRGDITNIQGDVTDLQGDISDLDNRLNSLTLEDLPYVRYTTGLLSSYPWDGYSDSNELIARMCEMIDTNSTYIGWLKSGVYLDYGLSSGEYIDYSINQQALSGHLTGSSKSVYIFIPFNKYLLFRDSAYSFTISGDITIRAINGYLRDSGNTYNFNGVDISAYKPQIYKNNLGFRLVLTLPTVASATNNTPITAYFSGNGKIRITVL